MPGSGGVFLGIYPFGVVRLPGLTAGVPALQRGQSSGLYVGSVSVASAAFFRGNVAVPPLRSINAPTPTRTPWPSSTTLMTSRVEPPVVITSSTTRQRSPGARPKPRRRRITPSSRSPKRHRAPSAGPPRHLMGDEDAADGGRQDHLDAVALERLGQLPAERLGVGRMLEDE